MPPLYVGLDIGGTKLLVASADDAGKIGARMEEPTPTPLAAGLALLDEMIGEVTAGAAITSIGVSIGGPIDRARGTVSPLHQETWRDVPLRARLEKRWRCPVSVEVDTDAAVLGEARFSSAKVPRLLYLTLSTGMGGGFLVDGEIVRGRNGVHPEVGHQAVPFRCAYSEKVACECGIPDCLEGLVSGRAIERIYGKRVDRLDVAEFAEVAYHLGQGLRNLAVILAPDVIVCGGSVALHEKGRLVHAAGEVMGRHLKLVPAPEVRLAAFGHDAPLMGTIALAHDAAR